MNQHIQKQLDTSRRVDENTKLKKHSSGRPIVIGDIILWGLLVGQVINNEQVLILINFSLSEINVVYEIISDDGNLPRLKKIMKPIFG